MAASMNKKVADDAGLSRSGLKCVCGVVSAVKERTRQKLLLFPCCQATAHVVLTILMVLNYGCLSCNAGDTLEQRGVFTKPLEVIDNSLVYFEITEPASLRYIYTARPARNFGTAFNQSYTSVELLIGEPLRGCSRLLNSEYIRGNAVMLLRGECSFLTKTIHAQEAGALFVMISDDDEGGLNSRVDMVSDETGRTVHIPSLFLSGKDGANIRKDMQKTAENYALLNIPVNLTAVPLHKRNHPPWTLW